jgi:hypothetical protein
MSVIKQAEPKAKSREAGNNRVRLEAARKTIEELEGAGKEEAEATG